MKPSERLQRIVNNAPRHMAKDQLELAALVEEVRALEEKIESLQKGQRFMIEGLAGKGGDG